MKRGLRLLTVPVAVACLVAVGVSFFFGCLRVQRDADAFAAALETCTPFGQRARVPFLRSSLPRTVEGPEAGTCVVTIPVLGAGQLRCEFGDGGRMEMLRYVRNGAETVTFLGGQTASVRYTSENPDPLSRLLNGPECVLESG